MKLPNLILPPLPQSPTIDPQLRTWAEDISRYLLDFNQKAREILFNDAEIITYTTNPVANSEDAIKHHLDRIPQGYFILKKDKAADIYTGTTPWTTNTIYLKCSVASATLTILIF